MILSSRIQRYVLPRSLRAGRFPCAKCRLWSLCMVSVLYKECSLRSLTFTPADDKIFSCSPKCAANHELALFLSLETTDDSSSIHVN